MTATMTSARVLGVATAIAAAAVVAGPAAVAVPGGLLLAFALPGLALTGVVFRRHELSGVERVVLAPALSLATLILSGLLMNAVGIDLDRLAWTSAAAGVTLLALFAGVFPARGADRVATGGPAAGGREPALAAAVAARAAAGAGTVARAPAFSPEDTVRLVVVAPPVTGEERTAPARDTPAATAATPAGTAVEPGTGDAGPRPLVRQLLPLVLAVLVAGGAGWLSYDSSRASATRTVTTLSSTPPGALSAAGTHVVRVTAGGLTPAEGPFTIDVRGDVGRSLERRAVTPVDGAWTAELSLPGRERVTISLLRGTDSTPYRSVVIAAAG